MWFSEGRAKKDIAVMAGGVAAAPLDIPIELPDDAHQCSGYAY